MLPKDISIYGAVLMSRSGEVSRYCLESLLIYCKKIIVVLDNEDDRTRDMVMRMAKSHREIMVIKSSYPGTTKEHEEKDPRCIFNRFKGLQGKIREEVLIKLRELSRNGEKIDILIWPDGDECFTANLPKLLDEFWNSKYKALAMKAVDVFGDFGTIHDEGMTCHSRIFKYSDELLADPHKWGCHLLPIKRHERMGDRFTLVHMSLLGERMIKWRDKYWNKGGKPRNLEIGLWKTGEDVRKLLPEQIQEIYKRPNDITVGDYLRGGNKRQPCGTYNLNRALREASNFLDIIGVRHYLGFGTALSLYRDNKMLPWEFDIDLLILEEDKDKLLNNVEKLKEFNITDFKCKKDIPKWKKLDGTVSEETIIRTFSFRIFDCRIDMDPLYLSKCGNYRYVIKGRKREQFVGELKKEWIDNATALEFDGKKYKVPNPIEDYLISNYGKTWNTPINCVTGWNERACRRNNWEV
jgi:hypothetical protein